MWFCCKWANIRYNNWRPHHWKWFALVLHKLGISGPYHPTPRNTQDMIFTLGCTHLLSHTRISLVWKIYPVTERPCKKIIFIHTGMPKGPFDQTKDFVILCRVSCALSFVTNHRSLLCPNFLSSILFLCMLNREPFGSRRTDSPDPFRQHHVAPPRQVARFFRAGTFQVGLVAQNNSSVWSCLPTCFVQWAVYGV